MLHLAGVSLNLFHLIALVLAAGLGLDYALFFERAADDPAEQRRTLHAVLVCSLSTLMVFALLAMSSLPVLRSIGVTVSAGVVCNFVLALLLTRPAGSLVTWRPRVAELVPARGQHVPARARARSGTMRQVTLATTHAPRPGQSTARATVDCALSTSASTARRQWRCTADCTPAPAARAPGPGCWCRCVMSFSTATTCTKYRAN